MTKKAPSSTKADNRLPMVSFRLDEETFAALRELEDALPGDVVNSRKRSLAIRTAIRDAWIRLRGDQK